MIRITTANGLKQKPKDFDFAIFPNIIFSQPPESVGVIDRSCSFAIAFEWGYWALIFWFIKTK